MAVIGKPNSKKLSQVKKYVMKRDIKTYEQFRDEIYDHMALNSYEF